MTYVTPSEAAKFHNVSITTLRRWEINGKISSIRTEGKHRRYKISKKVDGQQKKSFIYARVSSQKQKEDLDRQIKFLSNKFPNYQVIKDISSGLNFERKGLQTLLDELFEANIEEVVVYAKDRLCRFGFSLFEYLFRKFGAKLTVIQDCKDKTEQQELAEDILAITTVFAAKIHGKRKYNIL